MSAELPVAAGDLLSPPPAGTAAGPATPVRGAAARPGTLPASPLAGERVPGPRTWVVGLPPGLRMVTLNHRLHWAEQSRRMAAITKAAWALARQQKIPLLLRVSVTAEYRPPDRRDYDPDNIAPAVKAAIDGIKHAGVIADDSSAYVAEVRCVIGPVVPRGRLILHITEVAP